MSATATKRVTSVGNVSISDPARGIGLVIEPNERPLLWIVMSVFRRLDNGAASDPFKVEYGKN